MFTGKHYILSWGVGGGVPLYIKLHFSVLTLQVRKEHSSIETDFSISCVSRLLSLKLQAEMYLPVKCSSFPKSHLCYNRFHSFSGPSSAAPSCCMWKHKMLLLWSNEAVKFQKQYFTSWPSEMKSPLVIFYIAGKP